MTRQRRAMTVGVAIGIISMLGAGPAAAHSQTVTPPGHDEPVRDGEPVSRLWAQAHCHASSPEVLGDGAGVATFEPAGALPCLDSYENPAGRSHPHAEPGD